MCTQRKHSHSTFQPPFVYCFTLFIFFDFLTILHRPPNATLATYKPITVHQFLLYFMFSMQTQKFQIFLLDQRTETTCKFNRSHFFPLDANFDRFSITCTCVCLFVCLLVLLFYAFLLFCFVCALHDTRVMFYFSSSNQLNWLITPTMHRYWVLANRTKIIKRYVNRFSSSSVCPNPSTDALVRFYCGHQKRPTPAWQS